MFFPDVAKKKKKGLEKKRKEKTRQEKKRKKKRGLFLMVLSHMQCLVCLNSNPGVFILCVVRDEDRTITSVYLHTV